MLRVLNVRYIASDCAHDEIESIGSTENFAEDFRCTTAY